MNVRMLSTNALFAAMLALGYAGSSHAIGEVTCETPELAAVGLAVAHTGSASDTVDLAYVEVDGSIYLTESEPLEDPGLNLAECIAGADPSLSALGSGDAGSH